MIEINDILDEREKTHGDFYEQAFTAQEIKTAMHKMPNWRLLPPNMHEALEMVATKIARIGNGAWHEKDHWDDCIGYLTLVARGLESND